MRPLKLILGLGSVVMALALAACGSLSSIEIPSKKVDYKSAGKLPPLEVPPDLTQPTADDRYVVPDVNPKGTATYSAYSKERTGDTQSASDSVLPQLANAHIERAGTERWLVVKGDPAQIWPVVKDFWQENGFIVNVDRPEAGIMETDWAENRAKISDDGMIRNFLGKILDSVYSTSERDKFRTRLERGPNGTTEIYISHRGMEEVYTSASNENTVWQPRPPDPGLEAEMLRRLMVRFGVQQDRAKAQLAAAPDTAPRATLSRNGDGATLSLDDQFDRAWRRVGLALDRVGFTVEDRDRSKGLYYVRYIDPDADNKTAEKGWFSKLKFWGGSSDKKKNERYRILVKGAESGSQVNVLNKDGAQEHSETAGRILSLLYEQLK